MVQGSICTNQINIKFFFKYKKILSSQINIYKTTISQINNNDINQYMYINISYMTMHVQNAEYQFHIAYKCNQKCTSEGMTKRWLYKCVAMVTVKCLSPLIGIVCKGGERKRRRDREIEISWLGFPVFFFDQGISSKDSSCQVKLENRMHSAFVSC